MGGQFFFPVGGNHPKGRKYPPCGKDTHHGEKTPTTKYLPWGEANMGEPGDFTSFHVLPPNVKQGFSTCFDKCDSNLIFSQYSPQISKKNNLNPTDICQPLAGSLSTSDAPRSSIFGFQSKQNLNISCSCFLRRFTTCWSLFYQQVILNVVAPIIAFFHLPWILNICKNNFDIISSVKRHLGVFVEFSLEGPPNVFGSTE